LMIIDNLVSMQTVEHAVIFRYGRYVDQVSLKTNYSCR